VFYKVHLLYALAIDLMPAYGPYIQITKFHLPNFRSYRAAQEKINSGLNTNIGPSGRYFGSTFNPPIISAIGAPFLPGSCKILNLRVSLLDKDELIF